MTDPAIIASLITVIAVVILAIANLVYRFGRLAAQVEHLRRDESRRHDEMRREARTETDREMRGWLWAEVKRQKEREKSWRTGERGLRITCIL